MLRRFLPYLAIALLLTASVRADEIIDRVLAVVAGDVIMLSDVSAARDLKLVRIPPDPDNATEGRSTAHGDPTREILTQLIDRSLILAEVERYAPPDPAPDAIAAEVRTIGARFRTEQEFEQTLARVGLDDKRLAEIVRQDLRMRAYLDQRFSAETGDRRQALIDDWVAGLRRRAEIVDLYLATP
jgi:hypothetical protein